MSAGVDRRDFLKLGLAAFAGETPAADITLRIGEMNAEIGPRRIVRTLAYNGQTPGPLLRMMEGRTTTVEVVNETSRPELVHWHGFHVPAEVDGAHEQGTPMVQGRGRRRYTFTPRPSGTRWYHTHAMAGHNLTLGSYSGLFGMAIVEPAADAGRYDLEVPILLHEWEPFLYPLRSRRRGGRRRRRRLFSQVLLRPVMPSASKIKLLPLPVINDSPHNRYGHQYRRFRVKAECNHAKHQKHGSDVDRRPTDGMGFWPGKWMTCEIPPQRTSRTNMPPRQ